MRYVLLLSLFLLASLKVEAQAIKSFDVVQRGYWRVVLLGDTLAGQYDRYDTALKRAYDAARDSTGAGSIEIIPPQFAFYFDKEPTNNLETIPDSLRLKTVTDYFHAQVDAPNPDTLGYYDLVIKGKYEAESVNIAVNCYDGQGNYRASGQANLNSDGEWVWRERMTCNGIATYWININGSENNFIDFIDIAHRRSIGQ